ncbi:MAG: ATP-binding cassette domain-containing protein [Myxococcota bacterium]|nr:ATP-binding cassette domain-containing protein [Myxococcota bacterium]
MIEARGLVKRFGRHDVLQGIDLSIGSGDRVALVGPNGSGKTTLIRCLLGLYQHEGSIALDGISARAERRRALGRVGFVPQLPPGLRGRVRDYLTTLEAVTGVPRAAVEAVAGRLGLALAPLERRAFSALSGGMKQKLLIAAALARRPTLLIMDEPGANLDPRSRAVFFELLAESAAGTTMLLSSHRVDEIADLVNRMVELDHGRVVMDDIVAAAAGPARAAEALRVRLRVREAVASMEEALRDWGLEAEGPEAWTGEIAAGDRFRFLALLTRYAGLIDGVELRSAAAPAEDAG